MQKLRLKDLDVKGKKVLMRVDFNVPLKNGIVHDDSRIRAALPSIHYVLDHGGSLILMSHLGRPKGTPEKAFSLAPCAMRLGELLKKPVIMAPDCIGPGVEKMANELKSGNVLMLENLRFHMGEEEPARFPEFVKELAKLGDCYVNDAFGTAHRSHASTAAIAKLFPNHSAIGFLMEKELAELTPLLSNPKRPFFAIIGGAKISSKIGVIKRLLGKVDALFIGGGMTYTFLKADGIAIGDSISENTSEIEGLPREKLRFPKDLLIANRLANDANTQTILARSGIPQGWQGVDIGPKTIEEWTLELGKAATVFWNGPLGIFEIPSFSNGTRRIAEYLAYAKAKTIVGGGDSVAAIEETGLQNHFAHLSTGGGASLEFLEFGHLPGIDALTSK